MTIRIVCAGKIKERFYRDAVSEYEKRLSRYCRIQIAEVPDEAAPDDPSAALKEQILRTEGERILKQIPPGSFCIVLAIEGTMRSSTQLAGDLSSLMLHGCSDLTFVIGGSLGLSAEVYQRADMQLSFSKMTFPHQLMRVILLEQIYRSFRIMQNEPYHK